MNSLMNHKADKEMILRLSRRSYFPWVFDAAMDWGVIASASLLFYYYTNMFMFFLAILVIGNRQHALAILGHDGTHFTLSKNKKLNDLVTNFFAMWPIGLTVSGYRILHFKHHQNVGNPNDPELGHKRARSPQWDLPAKPMRVLKYALLDMVGFSFSDYVIIVTYSKPSSKSAYIPLFLFHTTAIAALLSLGLWPIFLVYYASLITTFMMFFRFRLWLEHQGTSDTHRVHLSFWQGALLAPHKSWLHWEHHKWMSIPYHNLQSARDVVNGPTLMNLKDLIAWFGASGALASGDLPSTLGVEPQLTRQAS